MEKLPNNKDSVHKTADICYPKNLKMAIKWLNNQTQAWKNRTFDYRFYDSNQVLPSAGLG